MEKEDSRGNLVGRGLRPRRMRDSGVEWLGQVPEGWGVLPARNMFVEVKDKNVDGKESRQFSFRYGQIVDKDKSGRTDVTTDETITAYRIVSPDTIMINGLNLNYDFISQRVAIVKERGIITSAYLAVFPKKELVDPSYAVYLFKGYDSKQVFHGHGSGIRKTLNFSDFKEIKTVCPPLPEQRAIAAYLDEKCAKIDGMVAEAKETIEEYKKWKASVIFEAVTGKKEVEVEGRGRGRDCGETVGRDLRARRMRDAGVEWIGSVPEGWQIRRLRPLTVKIGSGKTPSGGASVYQDSGVMFLRSQNIYDEGLHIDDVSYISDEIDGEMASTRVLSGDVLLNITGGSIGRCCIFSLNCLANVNQHVCIIRTKKDVLIPDFLRYYLNACNVDIVGINQVGGNRQGLNFDQIGETKLPVPSIDEQRAIAAYLDRKCAAIDRVVAEKEALIADLEAYKKSLIFEVVTGKREVA